MNYWQEYELEILMKTIESDNPSFTIWKNLLTAMNGTGDVDAAVSRKNWMAIENEIVNHFASRTTNGFLIVCDHIPNTRIFAFVTKKYSKLIEIDVCDGTFVRFGIPIGSADLFYKYSEVRDGFRVLGEPCEKVIKIFLLIARLDKVREFRSLANNLQEVINAKEEIENVVIDLFPIFLQKRAIALIQNIYNGKRYTIELIKYCFLALLYTLSHPKAWQGRLSSRRAKRICPTCTAIQLNERKYIDFDIYLKSVLGKDRIRRVGNGSVKNYESRIL
jgi:hypothetical protein